MATFEKGYRKKHGCGLIRRTTAGRYTAELNLDGKRRRETFADEAAAREWISKKTASRMDNGKIAMELTGRETHDATSALLLLKENDLSSTTLLDCARVYVEQHRPTGISDTVREVYERQIDHLEHPQDDGSPARPRTIASKRARLSGFIEAHGDIPIRQVSSGDVDRWIAGIGASGRNLLNYRMEVQSLFNFAARESNGDFVNTVANFPQRKKKEVAPAAILTAANVKTYLHALETNPRTPTGWQSALCVALGCFAGIRTTELTDAGKPGLRWEHINFEEEIISIPANIAKTRTRRDVPITENLMEWLLKYRVDENGVPRKGRIAAAPRTLGKHRRFATAATGITWVDNAPRHSFATYFGKMHGYRVAAEVMGHLGSMRIFEDHYKGETVRKGEATRYFNIKPARPGTVIRLPKTA